MKISAAILSFFFTIPLLAQNQEQFFKLKPILNGDEPAWVQEMYALHPNVWAVANMKKDYYKTQPFEKNIHTQNFKYWYRQVQPYLDANGYIQYQSDLEEKAKTVFQNRINNENRDPIVWQSIGPFETYAYDSNAGMLPVSWQANIYCLDQCASNPDVLYCGTESAGLWRSNDKGQNWFSVSMALPVSSVSDVKVAGNDENLVYFSAGRDIYKSVDGGANWSVSYSISSGSLYQIIINPNNTNYVFAAGSNGLYKTTDGGNNWTTVFTERCWDINFHPTNPAVVYLLKHNSSLAKTEFFKSTDNGNNWTIQSSGWFNPAPYAAAQDMGALIAVSPITPSRVYVALLGNYKADDNSWIGVYLSENEGTSWANPIQDGGPYSDPSNLNLATSGLTDGFSQGFYDFGFDASHTVAGRLYLGVLSLSISNDGASSWQKVGGYATSAGANIGWIHPDIQDIHVLGADVWVATDGGINYSNDEMASHESRKKGIAGSHFWGYGQGWNDDVMVGGRYHNGNSAYYQTYGTGNFIRLGGGESATGYVNTFDNRLSYYSDLGAARYIDNTLTGNYQTPATLSLFPNEAYIIGEASDLVVHPAYSDHMFLGSGSGFYKSINGGGQFELLYDFGSGQVREIEISRQNSDRFYCKKDNNFYRSDDGGLSWTLLAQPATNSLNKMRLTSDPDDDNTIWTAAVYGNNGLKVYRSTDAGASWENMTSSVLDNQRIADIFCQGGSDLVYVTTYNSAFYWNPTINNWIEIGDGLPYFAQVETAHLLPFYRDRKMRYATHRGIWEADMMTASLPQAYPMTKTDQLSCARDTVAFDCHSILEHHNASWQWSFSPTPSYVSSLTVRNPKVVFAQEGSYDVSLMVTDGFGNVSSKTINNMVTLLDGCKADSIPGSTLLCQNAGDYLNVPDLNVTTNTFTATAWVKPNGIQPDYSAILMNDGDGNTAGFNFREGNNTLAYHWPGGAWWWDSNLIVPADEWSYVAMVATPNSMTVYVNGVPATHNTTLAPVDISTMKIGSYRAWGSRNYSGEIDEVCIWNRALTQEEIREWRHLTKEKIATVDPDLLAYYQFNETSGSVLDRHGIAHASLNANATRITSNAPVGGGDVDRLSIVTGGTYNFPNSGIGITFPATGPYPNGELVAFNLKVAPDVAPATPSIPEAGYWIINNYGNQIITPVDILQLGNIDLLNTTASNPTILKLHQRVDNGFGATWSNAITLGSTATGSTSGMGNISFANAGISSFGQFIIQKETCPDSLYFNVSPLDGTVHEAAVLIRSNGQAPAGSALIFSAGTEVCLEPGFEVEMPSEFQVVISGCGQ